ncbi:MAG: galactose mutarotase [Bacteroidales bacterium]|nr:galactose mutarotase [Bacteroidales bacterium]
MKNTTVNKDSIHMYELKNANGIEVVLTNYGARIVSVLTPDKKGEFADIALGYNTIDEYLSDNIYSGPIVGRFANRIKDAKFTLDGKEYTLYKNNGDNTLHGGLNGFDKKVWTASQEGNSVKMTYLSPDMEEGYPGNLAVTVVYTLTDKDELKIEYEAETDAATILNLTNHTIWNLKGEGDSTILDHYFMINADEFIPVDKEWIPTGEIASVEGTALDFREGKQIGQDIAIGDPQVENGLGFDHNWNLIKKSEDELSLAGKLWEETTGRLLEIWTTEPGMQFYSGNFLDGTVKGKSGRAYQHRSALIFETQHYPDAPNNPGFPTTVLKPGEVYKQTTIIRFKVKE